MTQSYYKGTSPYYTTPQIYDFLPYLDFWNAPPVVPSPNDVISIDQICSALMYMVQPDTGGYLRYAIPIQLKILYMI